MAELNRLLPPGVSLLYVLTSRRWWPEVLELLEKPGVDPNVDTVISPLYSTARYGHMPVVRRLLALGANPNFGTRNQWAPLHQAIYHPEVARLLLEHGADPNASNNLDWTPLSMACQQSKWTLVWSMLQHGGDLSSLTGAVQLRVQAHARRRLDEIVKQDLAIHAALADHLLPSLQHCVRASLYSSNEVDALVALVGTSAPPAAVLALLQQTTHWSLPYSVQQAFSNTYVSVPLTAYECGRDTGGAHLDVVDESSHRRDAWRDTSRRHECLAARA